MSDGTTLTNLIAIGRLAFVSDFSTVLVDKFETPKLELWTDEVNEFARSLVKDSSLVVSDHYSFFGKTRSLATEALIKEMQKSVQDAIKPHSYKAWLPDAKRFLNGYDFGHDSEEVFESMDYVSFLKKVNEYKSQFVAAMLSVPRVETQVFNSMGLPLKGFRLP